MPISNQEPISFEVLAAATLDDTARVIARAFAGFEPMALASGITAQDVVDLIMLSSAQALQDGLTVIARDNRNGRVVAAMLVDDFACEGPPLPPHLAPKFQYVWALLGQLGQRYRQGRELAPGQVLHFAMLAVERDYSGKKIGHNLIRNAERIGLARGYRFGMAEATSAASQHIFRQCGFIDRLSAPYDSFSFEGERVFAAIKGEQQTILMEKNLISPTTRAHHATTGTE